MRLILKIISNITIIALLIWFIQWYVKGHFGKYAIFFWLNTIIAIIMYVTKPDHNPNWPQHDSTPGYVYWERSVGSQ